jgi:alkaline phosphatase
MGPQKTGTTGTAAPPAQSTQSTQSTTSPAAYYAPTAIDSAQDVIAIGKGPGTDALKGFIDNTQIFQILSGQL